MADRRRTGLGSQESRDKTMPVLPPENYFLLSLLVGDPVLAPTKQNLLSYMGYGTIKLEAYQN
jgi:hypothetical protein